MNHSPHFKQREPTSRILSVSEISRDIRFALEGKFRNVWVEGEVSNVKLPSSGHKYFTLKDSSSQISCVMFRMAAQNNPVDIRDGVKIQVFGDVTVYEQRGQYQIVVQVAQSTGAGELQAQFEALKRKLNAEGLFDPAIKKPIPFFPTTIGLVTSPTGAALQDILKVMSRRAPWIRLIIAPVKVQGETASGEIARAIQYLTKNPDNLPKLDTIIVTRGGGSIEDLWSFNDEQVARAIHACHIPIISGVGHEIDFTICDFAADLREPTPSAAAEAAVPDGHALNHRLDVLANRLESVVEGNLNHWQRTIEAHKREMDAREPARKLQNWAQNLDYLDERLENALDRRLEHLQSTMERYQAILAGWQPEKDLANATEHLDRIKLRLEEAIDRKLEARQEMVDHFKHLLKAIGPNATLKRGFSMTLDENGEPIFSSSDLKSGDQLKTRFAEGEVTSIVK